MAKKVFIILTIIYSFPAYINPNPSQALSKFVYRSVESVSQVLSKLVTSNSLSVPDYFQSLEDFDDINVDQIIDNIKSVNLKSKEITLILVCMSLFVPFYASF